MRNQSSWTKKSKKTKDETTVWVFDNDFFDFSISIKTVERPLMFCEDHVV